MNTNSKGFPLAPVFLTKEFHLVFLPGKENSVLGDFGSYNFEIIDSFVVLSILLVILC